MKEKYDNDDKKIMRSAYKTIADYRNRLEEIIEFATEMGVKRIGLAYCISTTKKAMIVEHHLENFFEVISVHCKSNRLLSSDLIKDSKGISCNPLYQADYLNDNNTDLNIVMGLCIGHDMIFSKYSSAPISTLLVKDRVNSSPLITIEQIR